MSHSLKSGKILKAQLIKLKRFRKLLESLIKNLFASRLNITVSSKACRGWFTKMLRRTRKGENVSRRRLKCTEKNKQRRLKELRKSILRVKGHLFYAKMEFTNLIEKLEAGRLLRCIFVMIYVTKRSRSQ